MVMLAWPMMYCNALGFIPAFAIRVQNPGGLKGMMAMLGTGGDVWLADMADWKHMPNEEYGEIAQASVDEMMKHFPDEVGHTNPEIAKYRDKMLIEILKLHHKF